MFGIGKTVTHHRDRGDSEVNAANHHCSFGSVRSVCWMTGSLVVTLNIASITPPHSIMIDHNVVVVVVFVFRRTVSFFVEGR